MQIIKLISPPSVLILSTITLLTTCGDDGGGNSNRPAKAPPVPRQISTAYQSTCAVMSDGFLKCWGDNSAGQLGDGTTDEKTSPLFVNVGAGRTVKAASLGDYLTCALLDGGSLKCWGGGWSGRLGAGSITYESCTINGGSLDCKKEPVAVVLPQGKSAKAINAGGNHACAILDDDSLVCWGEGTYGQLGNGDTSNHDTPISVNLGTNTAKAVSAGNQSTCAILDDDSLKCWGRNSFGQLGDGSTDNRDSPVSVGLGAGKTAMALDHGDAHACAILNDGNLKCWGDKRKGRLGIGAGDSDACTIRTTDYDCKKTPTPVNLGSGRTAKAISIGRTHTCAILDDDSLKCWGINTNGELGYGDNTDRNTPESTATVALGEGRRPVAVSAGRGHTCAILDDDSLVCWGGNAQGQLGDGTTNDSLVPVVVEF